MLGDRHMPKLAAKPLHSTVGNVNTPMGKSRIKVAFFPRLPWGQDLHQRLEACLKVFDYHEIGVFLSDNYACCGMPALASGDRQGFEKDGHAQRGYSKGSELRLHRHAVFVVYGCHPRVLGAVLRQPPPRYRDAINALAPKAIDINALLVDVLHVSPKTQAKGQTKVTYHESCHLQKSLGVSKHPPDLIPYESGYNLVEMAEANRCCGCGGFVHADPLRPVSQDGPEKARQRDRQRRGSCGDGMPGLHDAAFRYAGPEQRSCSGQAHH